MPITVKLDLIKDSSLVEETGKITICRTADVSGMSDSDANASGFLAAATYAAGVPRIGDGHPNDALLVCVRKEVVPGERSSRAHVKCYYEALKNAQFDYVYEMGTALVSTESSYDSLNALVKLSYKPPDVIVPGAIIDADGLRTQPETIPGEKAERVIKFPIMRPVTTIRVSRTEKGPLNVPNKSIVGKVNRDIWAGGDPGTWLTYDVQAISNSNGATYRIQYTMAFNDIGWRSQNFWTLPDGSIPLDVDPGNPLTTLDDNYSGNGFYFVQPFKAISFSQTFGNP